MIAAGIGTTTFCVTSIVGLMPKSKEIADAAQSGAVNNDATTARTIAGRTGRTFGSRHGASASFFMAFNAPSNRVRRCAMSACFAAGSVLSEMSYISV